MLNIDLSMERIRRQDEANDWKVEHGLAYHRGEAEARQRFIESVKKLRLICDIPENLARDVGLPWED